MAPPVRATSTCHRVTRKSWRSRRICKRTSRTICRESWLRPTRQDLGQMRVGLTPAKCRESQMELMGRLAEDEPLDLPASGTAAQCSACIEYCTLTWRPGSLRVLQVLKGRCRQSPGRRCSAAIVRGETNRTAPTLSASVLERRIRSRPLPSGPARDRPRSEPPRPRRGRQAVARIWSSPSSVSGLACRSARPSSRLAPRKLRLI